MAEEELPAGVTDDPLHATFHGLGGEPHVVAPDVFLHTAFVNTYAVATCHGRLLIDPGLRRTAQQG